MKNPSGLTLYRGRKGHVWLAVEHNGKTGSLNLGEIPDRNAMRVFVDWAEEQLKAEANRAGGPEHPQAASVPKLNYHFPLHIVLRRSNYFWEFDVLTVTPDLDYLPVVVDGINCIPVFTKKAISEVFITDGGFAKPGSWRIGSWTFGGTNVDSVGCYAERLIDVLEATQPEGVAIDPDIKGRRAAKRLETRSFIEWLKATRGGPERQT